MESEPSEVESAMKSNEETQTNRFELFLSVATQRTSIVGGLKVSIVVGALVNLINQGNHLLGLHFTQISWPKLLVTFCVPFFVSIYVTVISFARTQWVKGAMTTRFG